MIATYISSTSFSVVGDKTATLLPSVSTRVSCGVDGYKYGSVVSRTYNGTITTVVVDGDALTANTTEIVHGFSEPLSVVKHAASHATGGRDALTAANVGAAPTSHAVAATTYGAGTETNYGHVQMGTATPAALGTAAKGTGARAAHEDHVHPTTGVMTTAHSANSITGFGTPATSVSTSTSAAAGTATTIARSDHNHNLGAHTHAGATTGGQIAYSALTGTPTIPTASSTTPAALGTAAVGSGTTFARADHVHLLPTAANVGALASGADINLADYKVQRPYLQDWAEVVNARGSISGAQTIDLELGNVVTATITAATTFTFSNPPATGRAGGFVLVLTNGGAGTITWPTAAKWAAGTAPTLTAAGTDLLAFNTVDAGTTWRGVCVAKDVK